MNAPRHNTQPIDIPPCLDDEVFGELMLLSARRPDFLGQMVSRFIEQGRKTYAELDEAISSRDVRAASFAAHRFKGAARQIGAARLANLAERFVKACERGEFEDARSRLHVIRLVHAQTVGELLARDSALH